MADAAWRMGLGAVAGWGAAMKGSRLARERHVSQDWHRDFWMGVFIGLIWNGWLELPPNSSRLPFLSREVVTMGKGPYNGPGFSGGWTAHSRGEKAGAGG